MTIEGTYAATPCIERSVQKCILILVICETVEEQKQEKMKKDIQRQNMIC